MRRWFALGLALLLLQTGCWNRVEVNDLGVVTAIGVDVGEEKPVRLSFYLARATGGISRQQAGSDPIWMVAREAENLTEAVDLIAMASPRRITLHHVRTVVIGEEYARRDVSDLLDFLVRNPQIRLNTRPMVAPGHAYEIFETPPEFEMLQSEVLQEFIPAMGLQDHRLKDFLVARTSLTHSGWMYGVRLVQRPVRQPGSPGVAAEQWGAGLFLADKMVAWASPEETRMLLWLLGDAQGTSLSMQCPENGDHSLSGLLDNPDARITPVWKGQSLSFNVAVKGNLRLVRSQCVQPMVEREHREKLEKALGEQVRKEILELISRSQALGIDPVGFGKRVQLGAPAQWRRISQDWISAWRKADIHVSVDLTIVQTGLLVKPGNKTEVELREK
ncbi:MAG: gerKC2 [Symbiobacteriaceae bacterium]|nr:gerKC2 [Symbiobacteriaceae bacterium]